MKCVRIPCMAVLMVVALAGGQSAASATSEQIPSVWHTDGPASAVADFASYELGSRAGTIVIDGKLTNDDVLGLPFSRNIISSGGPSSTETPLTGWVKDDGTNLYVAMDLSVGTKASMSHGDASVYIKQPGGIVEFKLSEAMPIFAMRGGFETPSMKRRHCVFEFKIPLDQLRIQRGNLEIAFAARNDERG